ncbi:MAG: bifunctional glutamine amidotransferase/anthranilate phosphoribosyltransferase [Spirochaetae bacterium HGW-Spirochaetae-1]|jgi:anthranilate synthase/phosphoribosyltransferase|nr:MAG: bifunctional glutamine amidotransferase/anthranilate phosphoribosyltransferase [Spirochaetae bacterium HGW-Spirochaetae-1]
MILLIDNYDSFTYNLKQYLEELSQKVLVVRNDAISVGDIEKMKPSHIIISPGPGRPEDAGITVEVIRQFSGKIPILGVCLGHQAIGYAFGAKIVSAKYLMHGKIGAIDHGGKGIFRDIPKGFEATRYHSLAIDTNTLPDELEVTAYCNDGEIMGVMHRRHLTEGVQFHPESILTKEGKNLLKNFLDYSYEKKADGILIRDAIARVMDQKDLTRDMAQSVMNEIMEGNSTPAQIASFLTALRLKGETTEEITAFAQVMRDKSIKIKPVSRDLVDTCGTGGDSSGTFNISTAAAIVAASAGVKIAKHGNRSISSKSGSADVLEALNVNIDLGPEEVAHCIDQIGIGFLFAPKLHPAMKYAIGPRREMGIRTVFNILGPLTNPASARFQIMGIYSQKLVEKIAIVLKNLGISRGYVVSSNDGLDEISISDETLIAEIRDGEVKLFTFRPEDAGYARSGINLVKGGDAVENAHIINQIFDGTRGAARDIVCLNAGFAIAAGLGTDVADGIKMAEESIGSGRAREKLIQLKEITNSI